MVQPFLTSVLDGEVLQLLYSQESASLTIVSEAGTAVRWGLDAMEEIVMAAESIIK